MDNILSLNMYITEISIHPIPEFFSVNIWLAIWPTATKRKRHIFWQGRFYKALMLSRESRPFILKGTCLWHWHKPLLSLTKKPYGKILETEHYDHSEIWLRNVSMDVFNKVGPLDMFKWTEHLITCAHNVYSLNRVLANQYRLQSKVLLKFLSMNKMKCNPV